MAGHRPGHVFIGRLQHRLIDDREVTGRTTWLEECC
jgi:hypothetical protein